VRLEVDPGHVCPGQQVSPSEPQNWQKLPEHTLALDPSEVQELPDATQVPVPLDVSQHPPVHASPGQHACPGAPHGWQDPLPLQTAVPPEHRSSVATQWPLVSQQPPWHGVPVVQQASPEKPQAGPVSNPPPPSNPPCEMAQPRTACAWLWQLATMACRVAWSSMNPPLVHLICENAQS
jgi:hypothetical protein